VTAARVLQQSIDFVSLLAFLMMLHLNMLLMCCRLQKVLHT
jgi:hypothetical protein